MIRRAEFVELPMAVKLHFRELRPVLKIRELTSDFLMLSLPNWSLEIAGNIFPMYKNDFYSLSIRLFAD